MSRKTIISASFVIFILLLSSSVFAHVRSGFTRHYTLDGYEVIYYTEPVRPKVGDTVHLVIKVNWYDLEKATDYALPSGRVPADIKPGEPVTQLGGFVDVWSGYSQYINQQLAKYSTYRMARLFLNETSPGIYEASYIFKDAGSYSLLYMLTDDQQLFQIDNFQEDLQVEANSPSLLFVGYSIFMMGAAVFFVRMNALKLESLRSQSQQQPQSEAPPSNKPENIA